METLKYLPIKGDRAKPRPHPKVPSIRVSSMPTTAVPADSRARGVSTDFGVSYSILKPETCELGHLPDMALFEDLVPQKIDGQSAFSL